jgi:tetratricopeptide (TPR) repeat protein
MAESHREEIAKLEALYASNPEGRVFVHLAEALRKAGEAERARGILTEGLSRHGDSASGYVVLGRVLSDLQRGDEAEHAFHRVLELDAANLIALRGLADLARQSGRFAEAARHYSELLARNPFDDEIRHLHDESESLARTSEAAGAGVGADEPAAEPASSAGEWTAPLAGDVAGETAAETSQDVAATAAPEAEALTAAGPAGSEEVMVSDVASELDAPAAPFSAAPGDAGDAVHAETEFGLVDLDALPGDLAAFAGFAGMEQVADEFTDTSAMTWDDLGGPPPDLSDLFEIPVDAANLETRFEGGFEAEPAAFEELDVELELTRESEESDLAEVRDAGRSPDADRAAAAESETAAEAQEPTAAETETVAGAQEPTAAEETVAEVHEPTAAEEAAAEAQEPSAAEPETAAEVQEPSAAEPETAAEVQEPSAAELLATEIRAWGSHPPPVPEGDAGLVTETMADLYMGQGFHERAAEVYRSLLERRPGDDTLLAKLRAAEYARRPAAAEMDVAPAGGSEEEAGEAWLRGVGSAWTGGADAATSAATPYAWTEFEPQEAESGLDAFVTIEAYLQGLVEWRGSGAEAAEPGVEEPGPPGEAGAGEPWAAPPAGEAGVEEWAPGPSGDAGVEEPWAATTAAQGSAQPPAADSPPPGEIVAEAAPVAEQPGWGGGSSTRGLSPVEEAFNEWYSGAASGAHEPPASEAASAPAAAGGPVPASAYGGEPPVSPGGAAEAVGAAGGQPSGAGAAAEARADEDEDLVMFRAWLQSLKK